MRTRPSLIPLLALAACTAGSEPDGRYFEDPRLVDLGHVCAPDAPALTVLEVTGDSIPDGTPEAWYESAQWARIARTVPGGWAGYLPADGTYRHFFTDTASGRSALASLRAEGLPAPDGATLDQVRWDMDQLWDWYRYILMSDIPLGSGGGSMGVAYMRNRLEFSLADSASREALDVHLRTLSLPCHLVATGINPVGL